MNLFYINYSVTDFKMAMSNRYTQRKIKVIDLEPVL